MLKVVSGRVLLTEWERAAFNKMLAAAPSAEEADALRERLRVEGPSFFLRRQAPNGNARSNVA